MPLTFRRPRPARKNSESMTVGAKSVRRYRPSAPTPPDIAPAEPHRSGSNLPLAAVEGSRRLHIPISVINNIAFGPDGGSAPPHLLRLLVSTVLATDERSPICIVLPSVERVASVISILAALECLSFDLPENRDTFLSSLKPGQRVRLCPTGDVFEVGGFTDGSRGMPMLKLHLTDTKGRRSPTEWLVYPDRAFRFEPTPRRLSRGTARAQFDSPPLNDLDSVVGSQIFGNSGLIRTRILLAGARADFDRTLHEFTIRPRGGLASADRLAEVFPFGSVDSDGVPFVLHPPGSSGQPMVAVARDLLDLEQSCLGEGVAPGSRAVLTDKIDLVLRDLSLAGRIGERQRLIAFADARQRAELHPLRKQGWTIWEISPRDIIGPDDRPTRIGSPGIDRSRRGAASEVHCRPGFVSCEAPDLKQADEAIARLGEHLSDEAVEYETWVEDILDTARGLFFSSSGWFSPPIGDARDAVSSAIERLRGEAGRLERQIGGPASAAVSDLAAAVDRFRSSAEESGITPKGAQILKLARPTAGASFRQVFVAGNRQSRDQADAFFIEQGLNLRCLSVSDLLEAEDPPSIVAFSVMRRDVFEKLIDPWPSPSTLFVGYDFEIDCYTRRLGRREALRASLRPDEARRSRITGLPPATFADPTDRSDEPAEPPEPDDKLVQFDRATREWSWTRRITVPQPRQDEEVCQARVVHFAGRSWSAMTDDHRSVMLSQGGASASGTSVHHARVGELAAGNRLILREGGDRDVIRLLAEQRKGEAAYRQLRERASLWRTALRSTSMDALSVTVGLRLIGVHRHPATIRAWLADGDLIAPRSTKDVIAISSAFPLRGKSQSDWQACCDAIDELRSLHVSAGSHLTELLVSRCGRMLFEPSDTELAVDLGIGIVWIVEVASIDPEPRDCPLWYVNRLQWLSQDWKEQLLAAPVREAAD